MSKTTRADLVVEGGGVRGVAFSGALEVFEKQGWEWQHVAGASAGAIAGALVAFGYKAANIREALDGLDFRSFLDGRISWVPNWLRFLSPLTLVDVLGGHMGIYKGHEFERWLDTLLHGVTMGEAQIPLTVTTVDVRAGELLYLSSESHPRLKVSRAVRMSMSIPFVFRAVHWEDGGKNRICVDGGYLDNYPIERFDTRRNVTPRWPTIGLQLNERETGGCDVTNGLELLLSLYSIQRRALATRLDRHNKYRSVLIDDGAISWLKFDLPSPLRERLHRNGKRAANNFLHNWHINGAFDGYLREFRTSN